MSHARLLVSCFVLTILLLPSAAREARAQRREQPQVERERLNASGKFQGLQRGLLHVVTEDGEPWLLKLETKPEDVSYYAKAEADWLQPGVFVQFTGRFNKKGKAVAPIESVRVITPRETTRFGVTPEAGLAGDGELFSNPAAEKKADPLQGAEEATAYQIVGKLTRLRKGEMTVFAGMAVEAELAENASIDVDVADLRLMRPGDSVKVEGWYLPGRKGLAVVNRITVQAAERLTVPKKKVRVLPGQKPADTEDAAAPAEQPAKEGDADSDDPFKVDSQ